MIQCLHFISGINIHYFYEYSLEYEQKHTLLVPRELMLINNDQETHENNILYT